MALHLAFILFLFALGASVGSFLNVVVWRWPRGESLISPPSHCPRCQHKLAWRDNIPVFGWIFLRGRCRYCAEPISMRYPIIEAITGLIFVFYYVMFFMLHVGPCAPMRAMADPDIFGRVKFVAILPQTMLRDWPVYALSMFLMSALLAISLIDAETFTIPPDIPWGMAAIGVLAHALIDRPRLPGALNLGPDGLSAALAAGGAIGLLISIALFLLGKVPRSFVEGEPMELDEQFYQQEVERARREKKAIPERPREWTKAEIRREIGKELLFLTPPVVGAILAVALVGYVRPIGESWRGLMQYHWLTGMLGAMLGALVGGLLVWAARILGTLSMGRVAMGLGDVHLMFGVGAIIGAGPVTVAFFLAPFAGLAVGIYMWLTRRQRELPYGPYLSLATAAVVLLYCPIADYLRPGFSAIGDALRGMMRL